MADNVKKPAPIPISLVGYDIPEVSGVANPSGPFRRIGVRIRLSEWAIRTDRMPWNLLNQWTEAGVTWDALPLTGYDADALSRIALREMTKDVTKREKEQTKSLEKLLAKLKAVEDDPESTPSQVWRAQREYEKKREGVLRTTERLMEHLAEGARTLSMDTSSVGFDSLRANVRTLRSASHIRAAAVASLTAAAQGTAMEAAAK